jgi:hypothetical protein
MDAIDRFSDLDFELLAMSEDQLHEFANAAARQLELESWLPPKRNAAVRGSAPRRSRPFAA